MRLSGVAGCAAGESTDMRAASGMISNTARRVHDAARWRRPCRRSVDCRPTCTTAIEFTASVTGFHRPDGALVCDGVPLADLAAAEGTPLYVYSAAHHRQPLPGHRRGVRGRIRTRCTTRSRRIRRWRSRGCCAALGSGADANSGGEIDVALRAGFIPTQIVFTGVGKTDGGAGAGDRPRRQDDQRRVGRRARADRRAGARAADARARRPARQPGHRRPEPSAHLDRTQDQQVRHRRWTPSRDICRARVRARRPRDRRPAHPRRIADHRPRSAPPRRARRSSRSRASCATTASPIEHLDLGGGLGVSYDGSPVPSADDYAAALLPAVRDSGLHAHPRAGPPHRRARRRAAVARRRREGAARRQAVRHPRRRHDGADAADALRRVPPHRAGRCAPTRPGDPLRHRRAALREQRHARQGPAAAAAGGRRSASPSSTPAPTAPSWRRTTTAGRCRRRCSSTAARWSAHPAPPDDRRPARAGDLHDAPACGLLIAFEGLDQSGKQTQAERLRDHVIARGRECRLLSFPDYDDGDRRRRSSKALHGEREYARRRHAAAVRRQPLRAPAATSSAGSPTATVAHLRSVPGVEHRVRRGAGARCPRG